jgi:hypothetical protein
MPNPYFNTVDPYFLQQDQMSLMPTFQNVGQQQANQQAALAQQNQQVIQAGQVGKQGGNDGMALAMALRKKDKKDPDKPAPVYDRSQPMPQYLDPAYMDAGY